jgi:oligosaccharide repeat unit polymerase
MQMGNLLKLSRFELLYRNDTRFLGIFTMIFPCAVLILFITAQTAKQRLQSYVFAVFAFLLLLLSGSRSTALFPALTGLIIWAKLGRRIPTVLLAGGVVFVLLAIPVIGVLREHSYDKISVDAIVKSSEHANIESAISELGGSVGVLAHTVRIVPAEESYRYGYTYITYLRYMIPNFGSSFNPEFSRQAAKQDIDSRGKEALFELRPSDWASYHIIPSMFLYGGGTGFSAIAEAYLNFGGPGIIMLFILYGALLAQLDSKLLAHSYASLIFATLFFCPFVLTVRNDFGGFLKPAEYTVIIALIWMAGRRFLPKLK